MTQSNQIAQLSQAIIQNISQVVIGKEDKILQVLSCLVAGGHLLLEDLPGTGKSQIAKALAASVQGELKRVQCTPDLVPGNVVGERIFDPKQGDFDFFRGPIFTNILLVDEINRACPRTQSAFLEAMGEETVSINKRTYELPQPFFVIATQAPTGFSGTYDLPIAQLDRFMMKISLGYPDKNASIQMLKKTISGEGNEKLKALISCPQIIKLRQHAQQMIVSDIILEYITNVIEKTRQHEDVLLGASPRAAISLMKAAQVYALLTGEESVMRKHIAKLARPVLEHRLLFREQKVNQAKRLSFFEELLNS